MGAPLALTSGDCTLLAEGSEFDAAVRKVRPGEAARKGEGTEPKPGGLGLRGTLEARNAG